MSHSDISNNSTNARIEKKKTMRRWVGRYLLLVAAVHTWGGIGYFREDLTNMVSSGLAGTVNIESPLVGAYFFIMFGFILVPFAFAIDDFERRKILPFPKTVTYSFIIFTIISITIAPTSGFWTFIPPSIVLWYRSHMVKES